MTLGISTPRTRRGFVRLVVGATVAGPVAAAAGCGVLNGASDSAPSAAAAGLEKGKITVGILASQGSAPSKLAEKYGYFKREGLDVTLKTFPVQSFPALINGELDFCVTNYVSYFRAVAEKTLDAKVVVDSNQATEDSTVIIAKPDSGIRGPQDLANKKVGINQAGSAAELLLRAALKDNVVDPNSVKYLPVKFADIPGAIASGQIDAGVEVEPYLTKAERGQGLERIFSIVKGSTAKMPQTGYVATSKFITEHPKTVAAFQRAMISAQRDATDRTKLTEVIPDLTGIDKDTVQLLKLDVYPIATDPSALQRVITLLQSEGGLGTPLDAKNLIVPTPQV
jgi:NitT/TauT family transport system substrate-binding protein